MIYLVLNTEDCYEPFVLHVCTSEEAAEQQVDKVKENFVKSRRLSSKDEVGFIDYVTLDTTVKTPVIWSAYDKIEDSLQ